MKELINGRTLLLAAASVLLAGGAVAADLRIGIKQETPSVDPLWSTNTSAIEISRHIFDTLIQFDENMGLQPGLAVSWQPIEDLTWEFKLRQGVNFHDGSPFTADDVVYTLERALTMSSSDNFTQYIGDKQATKIDDYTVHIKTGKPTPLMETDLATLSIVSKKAATGATSPSDFNSGKAAIGTGPYKFVSWKAGDSLNLTSNPDYWGGKPKWDNVTFKPITEDATRVAALLSGTVDVIDKVPTADIPALNDNPQVVVNAGTSNRPFYLWLDSRRDLSPYVFDNDGTPVWPNPLRDWTVRKAISLAINREGIVDRVFGGSAVVATQLLPPGFYGYNDDLQPEPYDPDEAKRLLAAAGYPDGFRVTLHTTTGRYVNDSKVGEAIAQMLTQVGITTELVTEPANVFLGQRTLNMDNSVAIRTYSIASGEPSIQLKAVVHTNPIADTEYCCQPTGMSNPRTDALIEEALKTVDRAKREELFSEAIGIAVEDVGIAPLYFEVYAWASRAGLETTPRLDGLNLAESVSAK
jgi:peptide/nickel transport system substrate-binding protein